MSESFVSGGYGGGAGGGGRGGGRGGFQQRPQVVYDGKRMRKPVVRKTIDFNPTIIRYIMNRSFREPAHNRPHYFPTMDYIRFLEPAPTYPKTPSNAFCTKYVHTATNKVRRPVNAVTWTPEGRRLLTGSHSGEFTLWNGLQFNFETILQAHNDPIRCMKWSHDRQWLVSSDDKGVIKYWQSSMNNVKAFQAHPESVRDISFCPTDMYFATASDDRLVKIWDFRQTKELLSLSGHHWDAKTVAWHPSKALVCSGSKDNLVKLWCPRNGKNIATLHGHKNTVTKLEWNRNGNWFITGSRDQLIKVWDIRMMKEMQSLRGHLREVTTLAWHPWHERLFASGSYDGSIHFWVVGHDNSQAEICGAHDTSIWSIDWHPLGHMLCSGGNDQTARFWTRNRPGDEMNDKYNANQLPEEERREALMALAETARMNPNKYGRLPSVLERYEGSLLEEETETTNADATPGFIPGLGSAKTAVAKSQAIRRPASGQFEQQRKRSRFEQSSERASPRPPRPSRADSPPPFRGHGPPPPPPPSRPGPGPGRGPPPPYGRRGMNGLPLPPPPSQVMGQRQFNGGGGGGHRPPPPRRFSNGPAPPQRGFDPRFDGHGPAPPGPHRGGGYHRAPMQDRYDNQHHQHHPPPLHRRNGPSPPPRRGGYERRRN